MRKARLIEAILGSPVALAIIAIVIVAIAVIWFLNERKEYAESERDRRNY